MNASPDTIPDHDVVLTTRARLARNLSDQPFLNRASDLQCAHVVRTAQRVMLDVPITDQLVWMDLEMTGLDPATDKILEIATVVTDSDLNILAEGPVIAIHQSDELLDGMDEWCTTQHGQSGLTARCKASTFTEQDAIDQTLAFLKQWQACL